MQKLSRFIQCLMGLGLGLGLSGCAQVSTEARVEYPVVSTRVLSDVAMRAPRPGQESWGQGGRLIMGSRLQWIDGSVWSRWTEEEKSESWAPGAGDPILADAWFGDPSPEAVTKRYFAAGKLIGTVHWADDRIGIIMAPAGSPVLVVEREIEPELARQFEAKLLDMKFDPGPVDGVVDDRTRRAVGFYLEYRGLPYRFPKAVINRALLTEILTPVPSPPGE